MTFGICKRCGGELERSATAFIQHGPYRCIERLQLQIAALKAALRPSDSASESTERAHMACDCPCHDDPNYERRQDKGTCACQKAAPLTCPSCGRPVDATVRLCEDCGTAFAVTDDETPTEDPDMPNKLPSRIYDAVTAQLDEEYGSHEYATAVRLTDAVMDVVKAWDSAETPERPDANDRFVLGLIQEAQETLDRVTTALSIPKLLVHSDDKAAGKSDESTLTVHPDTFIEAFNLLYSAQWIDHEEPRSRHRKRWFESVYEFLTKYEPLARQLRAVTERGTSGGGQR